LIRLVVGICFLMCAYVSSSQETAVPVEQEPRHHVVLKNDSVLVMHVTIPPGDTTLYHVHSHNRAVVYLSNSTITQQKLGEPEGPHETTNPGEASALTMGNTPLTHRVKNVGATPFDVIDIEFLGTPPASPAPAAAQVAAENANARVYHWTLAPGAATSMHTHERPYLIIAATPIMLKMTSPDGKSMAHEIKAGDFHWIDAKVTHSLANAGTTEGQIIEIELK
jgi:quercetin dioxygenase-like cupin family protein